MSLLAQHFSLYNYVSDDGTVYKVKMQDFRASTAGFTLSGPSIKATVKNANNMRHVCGRSAEGFTQKLYIAAPSNTLFVNGGSWTDVDGTAFTVTSAIGERRFNMAN